MFYEDQHQEKRYVMDFIRTLDGRQLVMYRGQFPLDLVGESSSQGPVEFPVTIDEMMNK